jgi:putative nucleotidyltransferase with HDIG domain
MKEAARSVVKKMRKEVKQPKWRRSKSIRWTIGIVLTLAIAALFPRAKTAEYLGYSVGSLWTDETVIAPFTYPVYKDPNRLRQDLNEALAELYPVYTQDVKARDRSLDSLQRTWVHLSSVVDRARKDSTHATAITDSFAYVDLSADEWSVLLADRPQVDLQKALADLLPIVDDLYRAHYVAELDQVPPELSSKKLIALRTRATEEVLIERDSLLTRERVEAIIADRLDRRLQSTKPATHAIARIASHSLVPNVLYSNQKTDENREALAAKVTRTDGIIVEGQRIIGKGDVITPQAKASLESLSQVRMDRGGWWAQFGRVIGTIGHVAVIILLMVLYLKFIRRRIYNDNLQVLLLSAVIFFPAALAFFSIQIQVDFPLEYLILLPVTSMLLTVMFDSRTGFYGTVVGALIIAGIRGNDYSVALAGLTAGAFAAYTVRDLRSRAQLFQSIGYILLGYLIAITALALERGTPFNEFSTEMLAALGNSLISPVLTLGVLYAVETMFDTVSELRLTEYDNINHPLLRELALRAPGTYQHTMMVAQLAENASIAIGANALLAKVGAYFHDIGKLTQPTDFIENQGAEVPNVHEVLTPEESAKRVREHVTQGIDLAYAHNLPERVVDFIPMHHGTLKISFFYDRYVKLTGNAPEDDELFRYPGPRPNSKETAIVMLADAAEAIARNVAQNSAEPSVEAIDQALEGLIKSRINEGQLDDCELTLKEMHTVKNVFTHLLGGLHHTRISYPGQNGAAQSADSPLAILQASETVAD